MGWLYRQFQFHRADLNPFWPHHDRQPRCGCRASCHLSIDISSSSWGLSHECVFHTGYSFRDYWKWSLAPSLGKRALGIYTKDLCITCRAQGGLRPSWSKRQTPYVQVSSRSGLPFAFHGTKASPVQLIGWIILVFCIEQQNFGMACGSCKGSSTQRTFSLSDLIVGGLGKLSQCLHRISICCQQRRWMSGTYQSGRIRNNTFLLVQ